MTWRPLPSEPPGPRPLSPALTRIANQLGLAPPNVLAAVFARWEELVGPDIAAHVTPRSLRDGVLVVVADHPAWATSVRLLAGDVLERVRGEGGGSDVRELVVRVDGAGRRNRW